MSRAVFRKSYTYYCPTFECKYTRPKKCYGDDTETPTCPFCNVYLEFRKPLIIKKYKEEYMKLRNRGKQNNNGNYHFKTIIYR